jgi:hypothetical protein
VRAQWTALTCTATAAVLGSAGAVEVFTNFAGAPRINTLFSKAEADALSGSDLDSTSPDINANFNVNLGQPGCLTGIFFYLGLDNNHGANVDLVTVLTHEFGHGLGFQTYTSGSTGAFFSGFPSIWDYYLTDASSGLTWAAMTAAQRQASALNTNRLVWSGTAVNTAAPGVLAFGTPTLKISAPSSVAGSYRIGTASFGPALSSPGVTAEIMPVVDQANGLGFACTPLSAANAAAVNGKLALVDSSTPAPCVFADKAINVQNAGAVGLIVASVPTGSPPTNLGGTNAAVTIPSVRLGNSDVPALKAALARRSRTHSGVFGTIGVDPLQLAGADTLGRVLMWAPNPFQSGSSVSHFDTIAFPNQLMEPSINLDLTHEITPPNDLSLKLLRDIGWP